AQTPDRALHLRSANRGRQYAASAGGRVWLVRQALFAATRFAALRTTRGLPVRRCVPGYRYPRRIQCTGKAGNGRAARLLALIRGSRRGSGTGRAKLLVGRKRAFLWYG